MTQNKLIDPVSINNKKRTYKQAFIVLLLTFLAFSRFVPGGDVLSPETGMHGAIEVSLLALTLFLTFVMWGTRPLLSTIRIPVCVITFLFGLWATVSAFWSPNYLLTLGNALGLIIITITTFTISYQVELNGISLERLVLDTIVVFVIILFLLNFVEKGTFFSINWDSARPRLLLVNDVANVGATYFSAPTLLAFHLLITAEYKRDRLRYILVFFISAFLLYLTNARTEMAAVIIAMLVIVVLHLKPKVMVLIGSVLSVLVFVPLIFIIIVEPTYLATLVNNLIQSHPDLLTLNGRISLWNDVIAVLPSASLWSGVGYAATRYQLLSYFFWATHAHNSYLEVMMGTGGIGVFLVLLFYISSLYFLFLKGIRKYIFPLALLIYISITSINAVTMFLPRFSMAILILFVFQSAYHFQFIESKYVEPSGDS